MFGSGIDRKAIVRLAVTLLGALMLLAFAGPGSAFAAPVLTIDSPASGDSVNESTLTFLGTSNDEADPVTLEVYEGSGVGGTLVQTDESLAPAGGTWSAQAASLAPGTYTAQAEQLDMGTFEVGSSEPVTFTVDTAGPAVSLDQVPSPIKDSTPSFSGGAGNAGGDLATVRLKIYTGTSASGSPTRAIEVGRSGASWNATLGASLGDGTYTAQAEQSDEAGNTTKSNASTFTIDTAGPAVSLVPAASTTSDPTPSLTGGAGTAGGDVPVVRLKIYAGATPSGSPLRTVEAPVTGAAWTATALEALPEGTYTAQAEQSDEAGNTSKSAASTFLLDESGPGVSLNALPAATRDSTPNFAGGAGSASGDSSTVTLEIYAGSNASGSPARTIAVTRSGGAWSTTPATALADGTYTAQAEQSDTAGNISKSAPSTFAIDTVHPEVSLTALPSATKASQPSFSGAAGSATGDLEAVKVKIYAGASASGSPVRTLEATRSGSTWTVTAGATLADGTYTAKAEQADQAGNLGESAASTFTIDTVGPKVTLAPGAFERHTSTPKFEGGAGVVGGSSPDLAGVTLNLYKGATVSGSPVRTISVTQSGGKWSATPSPPLANETYTAQAAQTDRAGNTTTSEPSTFVVVTKGPLVTVSSLSSPTSDATPSFSGSAASAPGDSEVTVRVYAGTVASPESEVRKVKASSTGSSWSAALTEALPDGTYTALAEQSDSLSNIGVSGEAKFRIDTTAPAVGVSTPADGSATSGSSEIVEGTAGSALGDSGSISLTLFAGLTAGPQAPLQTRVVVVVEGHWRADIEGLAAGSYTVQAEQGDDAGNTGSSQPVSFTILAAAGSQPRPPTSAFTWLPSSPHTGETVSLLSSSTDGSSPIAAFAWDLTGNGSFAASQPALTTTFSSPGNHVVRLRVTAADGLSSVAAETIPVSGPAVVLMQPFPVVRILSTDTASGIRLKLLSVRAIAGARIAVSCRARGCPTKLVVRLARKGKGGVVPAYAFRPFQRALRAGVMLEIRVSKAGLIGKYTRLAIKRGKLPERLDRCLSPTASRPIACPKS